MTINSAISLIPTDLRRFLTLLYATADDDTKATVLSLIKQKIKNSAPYQRISEVFSYEIYEESSLKFRDQVHQLKQSIDTVTELSEALQLAQTVSSLARLWDEQIAMMHKQLSAFPAEVFILPKNQTEKNMMYASTSAKALYLDLFKFLTPANQRRYAVPPSFNHYNEAIRHVSDLQGILLETPLLITSAEAHQYANDELVTDQCSNKIIVAFRDVRKIKTWIIDETKNKLRSAQIWENPVQGSAAVVAMPWGSVSISLDKTSIRTFGSWFSQRNLAVKAPITQIVRSGEDWITIDNNNEIARWTRQTTKPITLHHSDEVITHVSANEEIVCVRKRGQPDLFIYDARTGKAMKTVHTEINHIIQIGIDGETLWAAGNDECLTYNVKTGSQSGCELFPQIDEVSYVRLSRGHMFIGDTSGHIQVFGLQSGRRINSFTAHKQKIKLIVPIESGLVTVGAEGTIKYWNWKI